jgi:hypothetical protein
VRAGVSQQRFADRRGTRRRAADRRRRLGAELLLDSLLLSQKSRRARG